MKFPRIIRDFMHATDPKLLVQSKLIYTSVRDSTNFEQPIPTMADLSGLIAAYEDALNLSRRGQPFVAIKNQKKKELQAGLLKLCYWITDACNNDRAMLESSGYTISPEEDTPALIGSINNYRIDQGPVPGSVIAQCDGVLNKMKYFFGYTLAPVTPDSKWEELPSSDCKVTMMGLESLKTYCFRLIVYGTKKQIAYSEIITKGVA